MEEVFKKSHYLLVLVVLFTIVRQSAAQKPLNLTVFKSLNSVKECLGNKYPLVCFKEKALDFLNETIESDKPMVFYDHMIEITRNPEYRPNLTTEDNLPTEITQRSSKLSDILHEKVEEYFLSRTVKLNMAPAFESEVEDEDEDFDYDLEDSRSNRFSSFGGDYGEGAQGKKEYDLEDSRIARFSSFGGDYGGGGKGKKKKKCRGKGGGGGGGGGKKGKGGGMMMAVMVGMGCMMAQMMMGKVAFMAGSALIVAKVALFLAAIVGLKKSGGGGGGGETSHVVVSGGGGGDHGGGGWYRSYDTGAAAHGLAYRALVPQA